MERRTLLKHGASGLAGLGAGYAIVEQSTNNASAAVSMGALSIDGDEATTQDGTIEDVSVSLNASWDYDLPSGKDPHRWRLILSVTDGEGVGTVDKTHDAAKYLSSNGEVSLSGSLTETTVYSAQDFAAPEGKKKTVTIGFVLEFEVVSTDGTVLAFSSLEDTADVAVTNEAYRPQEHGSADGTGSVTITT